MAGTTSFKSEDDNVGPNDANGKKYVLSLDIGTSNIRCHVYNRNAEVCGR